ncbi:MAG: hypothetical protein COX19_17005 [Desulfobacterales bacterium CG23_combo_of_CG06-09_8_20_14_all_51_8]|nr:MAG: hypothetical protein COX19_17005 [Desulfobacterales bacterium CG23_combo_of_CG06-09_8_20_14_all_51_8]
MMEKMKNRIGFLPVLIGLILLLAGCGLMKMKTTAPDQSAGDIETAPAAQGDEDSGRVNSYYLYMESEIAKSRGNLDGAVELMKMAIERDPESLFLKKELAVLYLHKEDNEKALAVVAEILEKNPESVDALVMYATIQKTVDKDADVKPLYEKVLARDPERQNIYQILGKMYFSEGDMDNAFRIFESMLERFPDDYIGYYYIGEIHGVKGNYDAAETAFLKALELAPTLDEARLELVKTYRLTEQEDKVREMYEQILDRNPDNIIPVIELSILYRKTSREKSSALLKGLGERSLSDANVVGSVLQYLVLQKRMDDAATVIEGMAKGAPSSPEIFYAAAIVYFEKGQMDRAMENFRSVPPDSRFYKNALMHMAIIYFKQKEFDAGIALLEKAMPSLEASDKLELIPYLSSFYKEKGMTEASMRLITEGLEGDPENTDLLFELGVLYDRQKNTDRALEQMQAIVKLDPEHADALNYIGYSYADKGIRLDEAETMIKKALALKPDNGYIIDSLGWVYFQKGRLDEALAELQRAVALIPDDPVVLEHLGDIYAKRNDPISARKYYEQALAAPEADQEKLRKKIEALNSGGNAGP